MQVEIKVAQLMCSRICHDMIGPIGAVSAGMELRLEMGGGNDEEALDMVTRSALEATRRVSFFRMAFGLGGSAGGATRLEEVRKIASDYLEVGGTDLDWVDEHGLGQASLILTDGAKLLLNLILVGVDCLPRGGRLSLRFVKPDGEKPGIRGTVTAMGKGARMADDIGNAMVVAPPAEVLTARNVHAHFSVLLASILGTGIEVTDTGADRVELAALLPIAS
jgi:histidine phosphotransferase ChpT